VVTLDGGLSDEVFGKEADAFSSAMAMIAEGFNLLSEIHLSKLHSPVADTAFLRRNLVDNGVTLVGL